MKSRRLLFQLVPSTPRTGGIGSGLLPTVTTQENEYPEAELSGTGRRVTKNGNTHSRNLADTIPQLLKTPSASDGEGGIMEIRDGADAHLKLRDQIPHYTALAPTPTSRDYKGASKQTVAKGRNPMTNSLSDAVENGLLPTVRAREGNAGSKGSKGSKHNAAKGYLDGMIQELLPTPRAGNPGSRPNQKGGEILAEKVGTNTGLKLQPAFALWMMGYPEDWCDLKDGE